MSFTFATAGIRRSQTGKTSFFFKKSSSPTTLHCSFVVLLQGCPVILPQKLCGNHMRSCSLLSMTSLGLHQACSSPAGYKKQPARLHHISLLIKITSAILLFWLFAGAACTLFMFRLIRLGLQPLRRLTSAHGSSSACCQEVGRVRSVHGNH